MATFNAVINGQDDFTIFGNTVGWDGGDWLGYADFWAGDDPSPAHTVNVTLRDADWTVNILRFSGLRPVTLNISDNASAESEIRELMLGDTDATVTLGAVQVRNIQGDGNNTITLSQFGARVINLGDGNDSLALSGDWTDTIHLGEGNNRLTLTGGDGVNYVRGDGGTNRIDVQGEARILTLKLDSSDNTITTEDGNLESFYSYESNNTFNIGNGGIQQIVMSGNVGNTHTITSTGFIGSLQVYGDATTNLTLRGNESFAGLIRTGAGNDVIKTAGDDAEMINTNDGDDRISTGSGYVTTIITGNGNDSVSLGAGQGTGFVRTGSGDDVIIVRAFEGAKGVHIQGGGDTDTVDLSKMGGAITVDLSDFGTWQDVAGGKGFVGFTEIEHVIGGKKGDNLTGNQFANTFTGGKGNDLLAGGDDADTFIMLKRAGRDTIADFGDGADQIIFRGATGLGQLIFSQQGDDVLVRFQKSSVLVQDITLADLQQADNFGF